MSARQDAERLGGPFPVIVADPPWQYGQNDQRCRGGALNHYSTMADEDIADLPIEAFAADDSILVMWTTWPKLADGSAHRVMAGWGFRGVTGCPWVKQLPDGSAQLGIGHWFMSMSEVLLIGRRGAAKLPEVPGGAPAGLIIGQECQFYATRREHSAKPEGIQDWLECLPGPRLELFARRPRPEWTCIGGDLGLWIVPDGIVETARGNTQGDLFEARR